MSVLYLINVENIADLRLQRGGPSPTTIATILGDNYPIDEGVSYYVFDYPNTDADDPPNTIWPTDPDTGFPDVRTGRWVQVTIDGGVPQINADWTASSGAAQVLNKPTFATVATTGAYIDLTGKPSFAAVAASGAYADLSGKPTIPSAQVNSDWNSSSGVSQISNKPSLATVATSGSYTDLTSKPTIQTIQRTRVQTNSTGDYTWTFPTAYGTGIIPVISVVSESASSTIPQGVQIVAISNTSVTIKVINLPSTSVLSIVVLGAPAGAQAYVHLTAIAP